MTFPTTSPLSDFSTYADGALPGSEYETGPYNSDALVVESGLCIPDPGNLSEMGNALWIRDIFGPEYEAWVYTNEVDADWGWLSLFLYDTTKTTGYILTWQTEDNSTINSMTLYDENAGIIWTTPFVPVLANSAGLGFETFFGTTMKIYTNTGSGWQLFTTITNLAMPERGYIGLGAFAP